MSGGQGESPARRIAPTLLTLALLTVLLVACGGGSADDGKLKLELVNGNNARATLHIEVADTPVERETGLSNRDSLGRDDGMLFVIEEKGPGFWMKDTLIPLTVAFVSACGEIVATADMQPQTLDIHGTDRDYRFGIEVNQGWFAKHSLGVGDHVVLPPSLRTSGC